MTFFTLYNSRTKEYVGKDGKTVERLQDAFWFPTEEAALSRGADDGCEGFTVARHQIETQTFF